MSKNPYTYAWAPITKVEDQPDGTVMVYGPMSDAGLDRDKQGMNQDWLDKAVPAWMREAGNVREQHLSTRAVGVGVQLDRRDDGTFDLGSHVVDPVAVAKVKAGVLKGYSVGIKDPQINMGKAEFPNGEIIGGSIVEVSLVDRPANPRTMFTMVKADNAGEPEEVEEPTVEEIDEAEETEAEVEEVDDTQAGADAAAEQTVSEDVALKLDGMLAQLTAIKASLVRPAAQISKTDKPSDLDAIVDAAVAKATAPLKDELTLVKADLAKVTAMPVPGGPVAMRTASQTQAARGADRLTLLAQANDYMVKADQHREDPELAKGYREKAAELRTKAEA